jgi:hypothetical protein
MGSFVNYLIGSMPIIFIAIFIIIRLLISSSPAIKKVNDDLNKKYANNKYANNKKYANKKLNQLSSGSIMVSSDMDIYGHISNNSDMSCEDKHHNLF